MIDILNRLNLNGFNRPGGTDKASDHSYAELYDIILAPYRERPITILEIGIYQAGSLLFGSRTALGNARFIDAILIL